jgi:hypothetical protein
MVIGSLPMPALASARFLYALCFNFGQLPLRRLNHQLCCLLAGRPPAVCPLGARQRCSRLTRNTWKSTAVAAVGPALSLFGAQQRSAPIEISSYTRFARQQCSFVLWT